MTLKTLLKISRPRFWLYLGGTYFIGTVYAKPLNELAPNPLFIISFLYFNLIANFFLYGINDYFDAETDSLNPKKQTHEHLLEKTQRYTLVNFLVASLIISFGFLLIQQNILSQLLIILFLFLSYFYSAKPIRLKAKPFIDSLSNILYVLPGFLGYYQFSHALPNIEIFLGAWGWAFAMHLFSAIPDIIPDKMAGLLTTAVFLGIKKSLVVCFILWLISFLILVKYNTLPIVNFYALIYLLIPIYLLINPKKITNIYWYFPYLNALMGFLLFIIALT